MNWRLKETFIQLWCDCRFFRCNVVFLIVGLLRFLVF